MTGAGIMASDLVMVDKGHQASPGNIVLVEVDGNWTLKFLRRDEEGFFWNRSIPSTRHPSWG